MRVVSGNEEHHEVRVELRVNSVILVAEDCLEFAVELNRAHLSLDLQGLEVVPKTRLGEPVKPIQVSVDQKISQERVRQGEMGGGIDLNISNKPRAAANLKANANQASKTITSRNAEQTESILRVKARGNLQWEVAEPNLDGSHKSLSDTYLNDDVLCKLSASKGANMLGVKLSAFARKRDIKVTASSKAKRFSFKSNNHEKMVNAVIAKALSHSPANGGVLTFCISEIVLEDA
jgi:hypothetical protein